MEKGTGGGGSAVIQAAPKCVEIPASLGLELGRENDC